MRAYNFGVKGSSLTKLPRNVPRDRHDNFCTTSWGTTSRKICEGEDRPQFGRRDSGQLQPSIANISGMDEDIENRQKQK